MRGVRARELVQRALGDAEPPHLALGHELPELAERFLDGDLGIHAVQVVEVEVLDAESRKRAVAVPPNRLGPPVPAGLAARKAAILEAALGSDQNLGWPVAQRPAHEFLVVPAPVEHRRVEVRDAQLDRSPQRPLGDPIVLRIEVVAPGCAHAAQAHARDVGAVCAEPALGEFAHARTLCGPVTNER